MNVSGATSTTAAAIKNGGLIVGFYGDAGGATHGFLENGSTVVPVDVPGASATVLLGLNNLGQAVGDEIGAGASCTV